ncbi:hypothetical protein AWC05_02340 [Mycobacterium florentinum]|uniref:SHOCT domain-containing protein n=1 Tax=Mycobacterium florentinum TaxID=292462 RepID=A0A1X1TY75_MYCFL|nr:hypothetical protein AWC05_02340 [Mycobacterium florentinum]BBX80113.1 hypothetical protein MFLOJ_39000 [Mycobacterium florentinum]
MYGYAALSASATTLTPFTSSPESTRPDGSNDQAAALAQATGTSAATDTQTATLVLPTTSLGAVPEVFAGGPAGVFGEMTLASMAGQAINGTVSPARRERIGATARAHPAPSPTAGGHLTGIAAEMREFAELLGKLGELRDAGLLTDEEFNEQKQRLLGGLC